jgi:hypothetical protein
VAKLSGGFRAETAFSVRFADGMSLGFASRATLGLPGLAKHPARAFGLARDAVTHADLAFALRAGFAVRASSATRSQRIAQARDLTLVSSS